VLFLPGGEIHQLFLSFFSFQNSAYFKIILGGERNDPSLACTMNNKTIKINK
jgi:hypothetical protein